MLYRLNDKTPVKCETTEEYLNWLGTKGPDDCKVATDVVGKRIISTVFLGTNLGFPGKFEILFETMMFEGATPVGAPIRYQTWEEAETGHKAAVEVERKICQANTCTN